MTAGRAVRGAVAAGVALGVGLAACSSQNRPSPDPARSAPQSSPTPGGSTAPSSTSPPRVPEPTTTNTLPPPPAPTAPAPSTAGPLTAKSLPVPAGWRRTALPGSAEEGFRGNGTWVHARDPRYAAQDAITIGCAPVTRDDYPDPTAALEGDYRNASGASGVGLVLTFHAPADATRYFDRYAAQVRACTTANEPVRTTLVTASGAPSASLIDRRHYAASDEADSDWTEVGKQVGERVTLIILNDRGHRLPAAAAQRLLGQIG